MLEFDKIVWMVRKDLKILWRRKIRLFSLLFLPLIMITFFGYGMGGEVDDVPVVVVSQSHGQITDETLNAIKGIDTYDVKDVITDPQKGRDMVKNGDVKAAIILPENYDDTQNQTDRNIILYVDSSDQVTTSALTPVTTILFSEIGTEVGVKEMQVMNAQTNPLNQNPGVLESTNAKISDIFGSFKMDINKVYGDISYMDFLMPAVIALVIMFVCMFGMGDSIAGERERGELSRLFMTPTSIATVVGGKIVSNLIIETGQALLLLIFAIILFGITINGNIILVIFLMVITALCFVGMGMMVSARASSQEDYIQAVLPFTLPMMFVAGVFYPIETMPWIMQKIAYLIPLTYANDALRAVMLRGVGIGDIWLDIAVLLGFTLVFFVLGVIAFNRDM